MAIIGLRNGLMAGQCFYNQLAGLLRQIGANCLPDLDRFPATPPDAPAGVA